MLKFYRVQCTFEPKACGKLWHNIFISYDFRVLLCVTLFFLDDFHYDFYACMYVLNLCFVSRILQAYPVSIFVHADDSSMPLVKDSLPEDVPDSGSGSGSGSVSGSESSDHSEEDHSGERHVVETKTKTETQQQTTKTTSTSTPIIAPISTPSVYDYTVKDIDGNDVCLSKYRWACNFVFGVFIFHASTLIVWKKVKR